jgi:hypothetical protein
MPFGLSAARLRVYNPSFLTAWHRPVAGSRVDLRTI